MKKDLYRSALTESWQFIWQHKILWVLGLFATFLGQVGIEEVFARTNILYWDTGSTLTLASIGTVLSELKLLMESMPSAQTWLAFIWLVVMVGGLLFFILFLALVSQGALIHTVAQSLIKKRKKLILEKRGISGCITVEDYFFSQSYVL